MAHGPVNRSWYVSLAPNVTFKVSESAYNAVKDYHTTKPVAVCIGDKTIKTVYLWEAGDVLIKDGYEAKNGRVYGKMAISEPEFDE